MVMNLYRVTLYYASVIVGLIIFILTAYRLVTGKYAKEIKGPVTEKQKRMAKKMQLVFYLFAAILLGVMLGMYDMGDMDVFGI